MHFNNIVNQMDYQSVSDLKKLIEKLNAMQYVNGLDVAQDTINELHYIAFSPSIKWDLIMETPDIILYSAEDELGTLQYKNIGEFNCSAENIWNIIYRSQLQEEWDDFCLKAKILEELDGLNFIEFSVMASPLGGVPRYFCLFKSCAIDLENRKYTLTFRSIDHENADQEINCIDGNAFFTEIGTCGWVIEEIGQNRSKVTYITQISESALVPLVPKDSFPHFKQLYKQSGMHTIYKLVSLKRYVNALNDQQMSSLHRYRFGFSQESLEIFKAVCETIEQVELTEWHLFRKQRDIEFYYRDSDAKVKDKLTENPEDSCFDMITTGFMSCMNCTTPDIVQSFVLSYNTHLIDTWTYYCETVNRINDSTSVIEVRFRSVLTPNTEISHFLLKQVLNLPLNITFIGFKSLDVPHNSRNLWYSPSGFYIFPIENGCCIRHLSHFTTVLPASLKSIPQKKILLSISERYTVTMQSMRNQIIKHSMSEVNLKAIQNYQPLSNCASWTDFKDKSIDEVLDLFFNLALNEMDKEADAINANKYLDIWKCDLNYNTNILRKELGAPNKKLLMDSRQQQQQPQPQQQPQQQQQPKRKYHEIIEKPSIMSVNPKFCFTKPNVKNQNKSSISPAPFTNDWDQYIKRRPFLLLVSNKRSFNSHSKMPRYNATFHSNSLFDQLPEEIVELIFSHLDARDLTKLSMTCTTFHSAANNNFLWKSLFESKYKSVNLINQNNRDQNNNNNNNNNENDGNHVLRNESRITEIESETNDSQSNDSSENWRNMYISQECVQNNWRKGRAKTGFLRGHKAKITCLQLGPEMAVTGSRDKELRIWSLGTKLCDVVLKPTNCSVVSFENDNLSKTNSQLFPYCIEKNPVIRIGFSNGLIYHYNMATKQIVSQQRYQDAPAIVLHGHTAAVNCLDFCGSNYIFTGSNDKTMRMWDLRNPTASLQIIKSHKSHLRSIKLVNNKRLLSADEHSIHIWELENHIPNHTSVLDNYQVSLSALSSDEESVLAGFNDGTVKFYDFT
ncbi:WD40 repeat-containing protein [Heterostelium album PN500]|uniref:WD40 repeat-containing protein n=1 Tax=Heterostelium pallidum (strain ATCC 26659 / Pp 5 / PN500) TaxID=670386 RepID=D3BAV1_HETP5|nr:WD40 repeat-containing protein [Heterostelium album PN500]EFA81688.1 WD40 repeat-containing protein [Heterostelium album PN500]|eukprot:XP_020433805.1 WD40 repeat-containing protein [Heterostelium album PN500]